MTIAIAPPFEIRKSAPQLPPKIVLHGVEGVGKTSFAAMFPKAFFLMSPRETGLLTLQNSGQVGDIDHWDPITDYYSLCQGVSWLATQDHPYKWIVTDAISGFERNVYMPWMIETQFEGKVEKFTAYGKDKQYPHEHWKSLLNGFDTIWRRGIGILFLAHTDPVKFMNLEGQDYYRYQPRFANKTTWDLVYEWADVVAFANCVTSAITYDDPASKLKKYKGRDTGVRRMYLEGNAAWMAKNRYRLPQSIDMGTTSGEAYQNFMNAFVEAKIKIQGLQQSL